MTRLFAFGSIRRVISAIRRFAASYALPVFDVIIIL